MYIPTERLIAVACLAGGPANTELCGDVKFYQTSGGTLVVADVYNLPAEDGVFALHVHAGQSCEGEEFSESDGHFNPTGQPHPYHAGDLPPLFAAHGHALLAVLTDRFTPEEVLGRTVIVHAGVDDFTSQPAGNSGAKIACGVIRAV